MGLTLFFALILTLETQLIESKLLSSSLLSFPTITTRQQSTRIETTLRSILKLLPQQPTCSHTFLCSTSSLSSTKEPIPNFSYKKIQNQPQFEQKQQLLPFHNIHNQLVRFIQIGFTNAKTIQTKQKYDEQKIRINRKSNRKCRTILTFTKPDSNFVWEQFFNNNHNEDGNSSSSIPLASVAEFNHNQVGITNPFVQIFYRREIRKKSYPKKERTKSYSNRNKATKSHHYSDDADDLWWPSSLKFNNDNNSGNSNQWRIRRYTRRIGRGEECYHCLRDAALDWEFHTTKMNDGNENNKESEKKKTVKQHFRDMGILNAMPLSEHSSLWDQGEEVERREGNSDNNNPSESTTTTNTNVLQVWSSPGHRKLATYTQSKLHLLRLLPPRFSAYVYAVNPIAVVYDLIDHRGSKTTYTSTAYGTLGGHWLQGEERVTVVLRDEECMDDTYNDDDLYPTTTRDHASTIPSSHSHAGGLYMYCRSSSSSGSTTTMRNTSSLQHSMDGGSATSNTSGKGIGGRKGYVDIEILSYSRPSTTSLMGKLVWPLIGKMQNTFFMNQLDALEDVWNQELKKKEMQK